MPDNVDVDQMEQAFRERYPTDQDFVKASPSTKRLQEDFPFDNGGTPGKAWNEAILMTEEQGVVYSLAGTQATLPTPIPLKMERARYLGNKIEMVSAVSLEAALRGDSPQQSMANTVRTAQESQRDTHVLRKEWDMLYGSMPLGKVVSVAAGASAAQKVVTFDPAYWVPALWAGATNAQFDIYDLDSEALDPASVKRNTSSASAVFTMNTWEPTTRTVTLTATAAADWSAVVAGDFIWWTTSYLNENKGMNAIAEDQTGSIFLAAPEGSVTVPTYGQWKGITTDLAGANLTMAYVLQFCADIADRSSEDSVLTLRVGPRQYHGLNLELTALKRYADSVTRKVENGFEVISYNSPNGEIRIKGHKLLRWGDALLTDDTCFSHRGVTAMETAFPGFGKLYRLRDNTNAVDFRSYSQSGMFCNRPFRAARFKNLGIPGVN